MIPTAQTLGRVEVAAISIDSPGTRRCLSAAAAPGVLAADVAKPELVSLN
jgi:hypothetical protein